MKITIGFTTCFLLAACCISFALVTADKPLSALLKATAIILLLVARKCMIRV